MNAIRNAGTGGPRPPFSDDLAFLLDSLPDAIFLMAPDGTALAMNAETGRRLGVLPSDVIGRSFYDFVPPDVAAVRREKVEAVIRTRQPLFFEDSREGEIVENHIYPIFDEQGEISRIAVVGRIITEHTRAEKALRSSEEKFRTLVDEAAEMLFLHDLNGRIHEVNRTAIETTGYRHGELLTMSVWDLDPDSVERGDQERFWKAMSVGERAFIEVRHRRKDGSIYPAEVRIAKLDLDGVPYILALANDISGRRAAEQKIKQNEQHLNVLLGNLPGMAYRCLNDPNWTMEFVSESALALTGHRPEALLGPDGIHYATLIHPGDRRMVWTKIQQALEQDRPFTIEYRIHDAQGVEKWVWEKGRCVDHDHLEGFITDISERKRYEQTLSEKAMLESQLLHLQKTDSINRLAGAVAHHFNNKLHAVLAGLELLRTQVLERDSDPEPMDIAMRAARDAAEISRLMLTCLGQSALRHERLDLSALCRALHPSLVAAMPEAVQLDLEVPDGPLPVWADAEAMRQLISHLVANAREAEGVSHVTLRVRQMWPESFGDGLRNPMDWYPEDIPHGVIEVADNGAGISETLLEQIFDPFFSTKFTGRGIGLTLVLGLTRSHGGGVIVRSSSGTGTCFRICIPEADGEPLLQKSRAQRTHGRAAAPGAPVILLAEDEKPRRELTAMMLQSLGYDVLMAADGEEAMKLASGHGSEIRCVLSDIRMPRMDGWQLLRALRRQMPDIPVILTTAYDDAVHPPDPSPAQADVIIRKPYLLNDIRSALEQVIPPPPLNAKRGAVNGSVDENG